MTLPPAAPLKCALSLLNRKIAAEFGKPADELPEVHEAETLWQGTAVCGRCISLDTSAMGVSVDGEPLHAMPPLLNYITHKGRPSHRAAP